MILQIVAILAGIALLVFGGDGLVRGAVAIAARLRLSPSLIGLTIVAIGTSMPELVVGVGAALRGQPDLTVGNVVGSNIYNVGLILGLTAQVRRLSCEPDELRHDGGWMMGASALFLALAWDGQLSRLDGLLMLGCVGGFLASAIRRSRRGAADMPAELGDPPAEAEAPSVLGWPLAVGLVVGGAQALIFGATALATALGVPEMIIGLTVVAVGTSLPELFASLMAALRGQPGMAVSNIIGSNLFNILLILGSTGALRPIDVHPQVMASDIWWMIGLAGLLVLWAGRALPLGRPFGGLMLSLAAAYSTTLF